MGLHEQKREEYASCLQEEARSGRFPKGSVINPHRLSEICGGDPRTAESHLPSLIGLELVGPDYNGKLRDLNIEAGPWALADPPSDAWMDRAASTKMKSGVDWVTLGAGLLVGGIVGAVALSLASLAVRQDQTHVHSWSPCQGTESWVGVCKMCGKRGGDLNDPQSPVHFVRVQN